MWRNKFGLARWLRLPILIGVAVLALLGFTIYRQWQVAVRDQSEQEVADLRREGREILDGGNIPAAARRFEEIAEIAAQRPQSARSAEIRRDLDLARQLSAVAHILSDSLDRVLSMVAADPSGRLELIHGKGFLLDVVVTPTEKETYEARLFLAADQAPVRVDLSSTPLFHELAIDQPTRFLLAMKADRLAREDAGWRLELIPDSVALVTESILVRNLGLDDPETLDLIRRQADRRPARGGP